jgi:hypothetical protein
MLFLELHHRVIWTTFSTRSFFLAEEVLMGEKSIMHTFACIVVCFEIKVEYLDNTFLNNTEKIPQIHCKNHSLYGDRQYLHYDLESSHDHDQEEELKTNYLLGSTQSSVLLRILRDENTVMHKKHFVRNCAEMSFLTILIMIASCGQALMLGRDNLKMKP